MVEGGKEGGRNGEEQQEEGARWLLSDDVKAAAGGFARALLAFEEASACVYQ